MEILQLRYFYESAKNESFAKTAQKYMVPTTSVSSSVKRLENELGCTLFDRTPNRILLNKNGKKLLSSLYVIFNEFDNISNMFPSQQEDTRIIKMLVRAMRSTITDYIIEYKIKHPNVAFNTNFDFSATDIESYDIIIDDDPKRFPEYEKFELCSKAIRLKAASNQFSDRKLTLNQLQNYPFLSMGENSSMHQTLMNACNKAGFTPNIVVQTNDIQCYRKCLESGIGIGYGRSDASDDLNKIRYLNVTNFDERQTVYGFYMKQHNYGNIEHFLNFLKNKHL